MRDNSFRSAQTDKGKEFLNREVNSVFKKNGVTHFSSEDNSIKASVVERFNRTLRGKIHRHITSTRGGHFLDDLKDMVRSYNATPHATIGMAPRNVDFSNQEDVWNRMYESNRLGMSKRKPKLKAGDHVRMAKN